MYRHHRESAERAAAHFAADAGVLALILGGSVAHGFAAADSDLDLLIVVSDAEYAQRRRDGRLQFLDSDLCTYPNGYVDGKYLGESLVRSIAERGSEPARFAFKDAQVLFSRIADLDSLLREITRYPVAGKDDRVQRFHAQFETWHWYAHEGLRWENRNLLGTAVSKLVLFGGRLILAHNEILYPFHKWFLRVLADAPDKPADLMERIAALYDYPNEENLRAFYGCVAFHRPWAPNMAWPVRFVLDTELAWEEGRAPVDDL
jgi:hypothetical protein